LGTRDGLSVRDFIHVVNLARGHIAAAEKNAIKRSFQAYNCSTGKGSSVSEVVSNFERVLSCKIPVRYVGRRAADVGSCIAPREWWTESWIRNPKGRFFSVRKILEITFASPRTWFGSDGYVLFFLLVSKGVGLCWSQQVYSLNSR
jgi:UDP-glucose 4-epimerase